MSKTDCKNIETNEENCPCTSMDCDKHGVCCECLRAHLGLNALPSCIRIRIQNELSFREYVTNFISKTSA